MKYLLSTVLSLILLTGCAAPHSVSLTEARAQCIKQGYVAQTAAYRGCVHDSRNSQR